MEAAILLGLQAIRLDGLNQVMVLISALGGKAFIWFLIAIAMIFFAEKRSTGLLIIVSVTVALLVSGLLIEPLIARPRPSDVVSGLSAVFGANHSGYSFPSVYAVTSFAAATIIAKTLGRSMGTPAVILAVLISFSCLYCGINYPSDILVGALMGVALGWLMVWLFNRFIGDAGSPVISQKGRHSL